MFFFGSFLLEVVLLGIGFSYVVNSKLLFFEDELFMIKLILMVFFVDDDVGLDLLLWDLLMFCKYYICVDLICNLLVLLDVFDSYVEVFDVVFCEDGSGGCIMFGGVVRILVVVKLGVDVQVCIMGIVVFFGGGSEGILLEWGEFNVLLVLIGLVQEGEMVSLDGVDECC